MKRRKLRSVLGYDVTLTARGLKHILERHVEMKELSTQVTRLIRNAVEDPDFILLGRRGEHIAIRYDEDLGKDVVVPYDENGEVKTAFISSKTDKLRSTRTILWKR